MLYLIQKILFVKIFFNSFNALNNDNKILIFHCNVFIARVFECSQKKKRGENPRINNIILDCYVRNII